MVITGGRLNKGVVPPKQYRDFPETKKPFENLVLSVPFGEVQSYVLYEQDIPLSQISQNHGVSSVRVV
jgi:hypothetical protein